MHQRINTYKHSTHKYLYIYPTKAQLHKYTFVLLHRYIKTHTHKYTNTQIHKYINTCTHQYTYKQINSSINQNTHT